ncbi:unnamed protein product [Lactuca saligna]|uniref:Non-specific serine/threonine protein kinase n=1 Tax=Lactuca saligna TaxID=75948 RepID=A0AA35ZEE3_LACSI|nr:unnamed protein product [Lactuca saligna]
MSNLSYVKHIDLLSCKLGPHFPIWIQKLENLTRLDISITSISDTVPPEFSKMTFDYLNLSSNNISGKIPDLSSSLGYTPTIDLSSNHSDSPIPHLPSSLTSLNLSRNKFSGDVSRNNLHGIITSCLSNLTRMAQEGFLLPPNVHPYAFLFANLAHFNLPYPNEEEYVDYAMIEWQGDEREFTRNLVLLKSIDLSSNNLTGNIPHELTNLHEPLVLNLSKNVVL